MKLHNLRIILILFFFVLLSACIDGGGNGEKDDLNSGPSARLSADGIWRGSVLIDSVSYDDVFVVINDGYLFGYSESAGELFKGNLGIGGDAVNGNLSQFQLAGTFTGRTNFTGTLESQVSLELSSDTDISFTLSYDDIYERSVALPNLEGTWVHTGPSYSLTTTFQSNGAFDASDSNGCTYNGSFNLPDPNRNAFQISFTASNCGNRNSLYQGFVVLDDDAGTNDLIHIITAGSNYAFAHSAQNESPIIQRSTDELRAINSGDFFEYSVSGQYAQVVGTPTPVTGTLRIEWFADSLTAPLGSGGTIPVIRESTTLDLGGGIPIASTIRYFQQDTATGVLQLLAISDGTQNLWVSTENAELNNLQPIDYFNSPVQSTPGTVRDVNFDVFSGCDTPSPTCAAQEATVFDERTYAGESAITTAFGRFNVLRVDYQGAFNSTLSNLLDVRGSCDANNGNFFGSFFSFPEVGVLFWENSCTASTGGGYSISASLTDTNVPLP